MKSIITKVTLLLSIAVIFSTTACSQTKQVRGTIYNSETRDVISGATITNFQTKIQTISDEKGMYKIEAKEGDSLIFTAIGMKELRRVVGKSDTLNITLVVQKEQDRQIRECGNELSNIDNSAVRIDYRGSVAAESPSISRVNSLSYQPYENKNEFETIKENRFQSALETPLSTLSLNANVASYGIVRRNINEGVLPERDAVRTEEFINYFGYNNPTPTGKEAINILTELAPCPWSKQYKLVRIGIKAKEIPSENLPASNLVFLIDVSGSMYRPDRLPLVKSSLKLLVNNLRDKDKVAIVVYASAAGEVLPSTKGSDKQKIMEAINALEAGGSTAGGQGIELAYKIAQQNFIKGGNNRVILCTDGDFNVGVSSTQGLEELIESKRKTDVFLTVLGYGMGNQKDNRLMTLAKKGNGNHAYIENIQEANKFLVKEFGSSMYAVAKDVKVQVEFNPKLVEAYRLVGYETSLLNKEDFNDDTVDAGELGAGHTVTALYEIVPKGVKFDYGDVDNLKYQNKDKEKTSSSFTNSDELMTVKLRYKELNSDVSKKMEVPVMSKDEAVNVSKDFNFVSAVAMFGQLLRNSDFKGDATYDKIIKYANNGIDSNNDPNGYKKEFVRLVESAEQLSM